MNSAFKKLRRKDVIEYINQKRSLSGKDLSGLDLSGIKFNGLELSYCIFDNCTLEKASFRDSEIERTSFRYANMNRVDFRESFFYKCDLWCTSFIQADLRESKWELNEYGRNKGIMVMMLKNLIVANKSEFYNCESKVFVTIGDNGRYLDDWMSDKDEMRNNALKNGYSQKEFDFYWSLGSLLIDIL